MIFLILVSHEEFEEGLKKLEKSLLMEIKLEFHVAKKTPQMVLLVTNEDHCLKALLKNWKEGLLIAQIPLIIGSNSSLKYIADEHQIPFYVFDNPNRKKNEIAMLEFLKNFEVDLIVLARYMKNSLILCGVTKIKLLIFTSLLPSFPGAGLPSSF